jgi:Pilus formation protein N terminal region
VRRALVLVLLAGCPTDPVEPTVSLYALTKPPPASVGAVVTNRSDMIYEVTLSQGVALAVGCTESCADAYGACAAPVLTVNDPTVLDVRPIYRLNGNTGERVLVAKQVGTTTLFVSSTCGTEPYIVRVVARPGSE